VRETINGWSVSDLIAGGTEYLRNFSRIGFNLTLILIQYYK